MCPDSQPLTRSLSSHDRTTRFLPKKEELSLALEGERREEQQQLPSQDIKEEGKTTIIDAFGARIEGVE